MALERIMSTIWGAKIINHMMTPLKNDDSEDDFDQNDDHEESLDGEM